MQSQKLLDSFIDYCKSHPDERFWQALRNWSGYTYIFGQSQGQPIEHGNLEDTFYKQ